jgi:hypothetical protein
MDREFVRDIRLFFANENVSKWSIRGRLHLRFGCAVWMCSEQSAAMTCVFDVLQNTVCICSLLH